MISSLEKVHRYQTRVRYAETDKMGVVYYGNYFVWFEIGRVEFLRSRGISYKSLEDNNLYMMVAETSCRYKKSARYDDMLTIETSVVSIGVARITFRCKIYNMDILLAEGDTVIVTTDRDGKPCKIPSDLTDTMVKH